MSKQDYGCLYLAHGVGELFKWLGIATVLCVLFAGLKGCTISKASAQCAGGNCQGGVCYPPSYAPPVGRIGNPSYAAADDHGWYKLVAEGKLGLWHHGEYIGTLDTAAMIWKHKDRPAVNLADFGAKLAKAARPKECICKGDCDCAKCPNDCVAAAKIEDLTRRLAEAEKAKARPTTPEPAWKALAQCGPDCPCGPGCTGNCDCCAVKPQVALKESAKNFGMDWKPSGGEVCTVNGAHTSCQKMIEALGKGGSAADIPDDTRVNRLLLISQDENLRQSFLRDAAKWSGKLIANAYTPDDWAMKWPGSSTPLYPVKSDPTVYALNGDGKVVGHGTGYAGPADFDQNVAAADKLRDKPAVDPLASPDLKAPPKPPTPGPGPGPGPAPAAPINFNYLGGGALLGLAGLAAYARRKQS
jgi:hypothetical protein